jgi:hypothetical protein
VNTKQLAVRLKVSQTFDIHIVERASGRPPNKTFHERVSVDVWSITGRRTPTELNPADAERIVARERLSL